MGHWLEDIQSWSVSLLESVGVFRTSPIFPRQSIVSEPLNVLGLHSLMADSSPPLCESQTNTCINNLHPLPPSRCFNRQHSLKGHISLLALFTASSLMILTLWMLPLSTWAIPSFATRKYQFTEIAAALFLSFMLPLLATFDGLQCLTTRSC